MPVASFRCLYSFINGCKFQWNFNKIIIFFQINEFEHVVRKQNGGHSVGFNDSINKRYIVWQVEMSVEPYNIRVIRARWRLCSHLWTLGRTYVSPGSLSMNKGCGRTFSVRAWHDALFVWNDEPRTERPQNMIKCETLKERHGASDRQPLEWLLNNLTIYKGISKVHTTNDMQSVSIPRSYHGIS